MENLLIRTQPCPECGTDMLWTQNAWQAGDVGVAAYRCLNGHLLDPAETRQCPACGVHDSVMLDDSGGRQQFQCSRCSTTFAFPH
jgi:endogenous inhibitor of DNA gyrase (YacG/DUF329 family)